MARVLLASALIAVVAAGVAVVVLRGPQPLPGAGAAATARPEAPRGAGPSAGPATAQTPTPAVGSPPQRAPAAAPAAPTPAPLRLHVTTVAQGLEVPWALAFAADGRTFVSERPGRVRVLEAGQLRPAPWATLPVATVGEGGLMGLALDPRFPSEPYLYAFYTYRAADGGLLNRLVRLRERSGVGTEPRTLLEGIPGAAVHDGGRLAFGPDGKLYVAIGDAARRAEAPKLDSLLGKILRLNVDGSLPADNPFPGSAIYSLGHRNVQGLAWDAQGRLYASEHGPSGEDGRCCHDEVNLVVAGGNYGWPTHAGAAGDTRFRDPVAESGGETWAPGGVAFWRGSLFVPGLRGRHLRRLALGADGRTVLANEVYLADRYGRLRAAEPAPDGALMITTSNRDGRGLPAPEDDRILRIEAAP